MVANEVKCKPSHEGMLTFRHHKIDLICCEIAFQFQYFGFRVLMGHGESSSYF